MCDMHRTGQDKRFENAPCSCLVVMYENNKVLKNRKKSSRNHHLMHHYFHFKSFSFAQPLTRLDFEVCCTP